MLKVNVSLQIGDLPCPESEVIPFSPTEVGKLKTIIERTDGWLTPGWDLAEKTSRKFKGVRGLRTLEKVFIKRLITVFRLCGKGNGRRNCLNEETLGRY